MGTMKRAFAIMWRIFHMLESDHEDLIPIVIKTWAIVISTRGSRSITTWRYLDVNEK